MSKLTFLSHHELRAVDGNGSLLPLDVEGLAQGPTELLMSSEPARLFRLPPWRTWRPSVEAQLLRPLNFATKPNEGMEALTAAQSAAHSFLGGLEGPVEQDDASAARLCELILFEAISGEKDRGDGPQGPCALVRGSNLREDLTSPTPH